MADGTIVKYLAVVPHGWAKADDHNAAIVQALAHGDSGKFKVYRLDGTLEQLQKVFLDGCGGMTRPQEVQCEVEYEGTVELTEGWEDAPDGGEYDVVNIKIKSRCLL